MGKIVGLVFEEKVKVACPHCGREYTTEEGLARHIAEKHPDSAEEEEQ